ncbi:MAG: metallophosphoesterase [Candidatus Aenigmatarchaeota archaeon]
MKIFDKFEVVDCYPALYIPGHKILVISDVHLGLEGIMSESGYYMPKFQFEEVEEDLDDILSKVDVREIVINGDLKHMFSRSSKSEWKEVNKMLDFLKGKVEEINLIKGNHDNYLIYAAKKHDVELQDYLIRDNILITHGHRRFDVEGEVEYIVIGHDHPVLSLSDEVGVEETLPCFIYGECRDKKIVMLPAFSKLSGGCRINKIKYNEDRVFSPVMRGCDVDEFRAIGVEREEQLCLKFPKIKEVD